MNSNSTVAEMSITSIIILSLNVFIYLIFILILNPVQYCILLHIFAADYCICLTVIQDTNVYFMLLFVFLASPATQFHLAEHLLYVG